MLSSWIMKVYFMILRLNSCLKALTHPLKQLQKHWNKLAISAISLDQRWKEPGYAAKQKVCVLGQPLPENTWNKNFTWKIHKWHFKYCKCNLWLHACFKATIKCYSSLFTEFKNTHSFSISVTLRSRFPHDWTLKTKFWKIEKIF